MTICKSVSAYRRMPIERGHILFNRVQVKAFRDGNTMGAFLCKQTDNFWKDTEVVGLKSGQYKIDMVRVSGNPVKKFIKVI
jgi:hypothetical protein